MPFSNQFGQLEYRDSHSNIGSNETGSTAFRGVGKYSAVGSHVRGFLCFLDFF